MKKRTVGVAYFSTNLDIHEMKEEFGNDLLCHVDILPYESEPVLIISMDARSYFNGVITGLKLKPGITRKDIVGNLCGKVKQVTSKRRRIRHDGRCFRDRNNAFRCTIYGEKM